MGLASGRKEEMKGNIKYRKELQRSYMIAEDCNKNLIDSYCGQMILRSNIKGLAKCEVRLTEGQREVWYEISSFHTLEQVYSVKEMSYSDLHTLLLQVITVISEVEKYLLDGRQLCFEPEYLYINMDTGKAAFLFDLTEEREESSMIKLAQFVLERVNHEETETAELAYFFYDSAGREQISVRELQDRLERNREDRQEMQETKEEKEENSYAGRKTLTGTTIDTEIEKELKFCEGMKKTDFWNSKNGKKTEAGLVSVIMALLSVAFLVLADYYFIFTNREKILWIAISSLFFVSGMIISVWGCARERREKTKDRAQGGANYDNRRDSFREETELWQWEMEKTPYTEEKFHENSSGNITEQADGRTIYVGKSLLNREYSLIERKKGAEKEYPIPSYPFLIGKEKERVNLAVKEHTVSRIHAKLTEEEGIIYIEDLHSTNGTLLNDLPLEPHERIKLKRGDLLQFGKAEFVFR
ncbi:DUF6382 domain-containing protein [Lachnospiraceae bacterium JLR.KK008]